MRLLFHVLIALVVGACQREAPQPAGTPLEVRLGYPRGTRLLIVHADDLGEANTIDRASLAALSAGQVSSASAIVPAPWFPEVAAFARANPAADLGLHLALTSEWEPYGWRPLSPAALVQSLVASDGRFLHNWPPVPVVDLQEIELEVRAQIRAARAAGLTPTHLDSHMGILLWNGQRIFDVVARVARDEALPLLSAREWVSGKKPPQTRFPVGEWALARVVQADPDVGIGEWEAYYDKQLAELPAGVSELIIHLAHDDPELRAMAAGQDAWGAAWRARDLAYVTSNRFREKLALEHIVVTTWRDVARAMQPVQR